MLYELMINISSKDHKYDSFVKSLKQLEEHYNKNNNKNQKACEQLDLYLENLEDFYQNNVKNILQYDKLIAYNYVLLLIKFYKYIGVKNLSIAYLNEFRKFAIRVMEIALFIQQFEFNINDLFYNNIQKSFYENLLDIYDIDFNAESIKIVDNRETLEIENNFKIHKNGIYIYPFNTLSHYNSTVKMSYGYKKISLASYLRLNITGVNNVYNLRDVNKKDGGGGGGQYVLLEKLTPFPKELYYENKIVYNSMVDNENKRDRYKSNYDNDEELESIDKSRKKILSHNNKIYTIKETAKKYDELIDDDKFKLKQNNLTDKNSYKKFKIDTAIGHLSAKSNLFLSSKYNVPNIKLLENFLRNLKDKSCFEYKLFLSSILLGIEPKRIIIMKLKLTTELEIISRDTIRVDLTTAYAQVQNYEIYKRTKNKVEFSVPAFVEEFFRDSEKILLTRLKKIITDKKTLLGNDVIDDFKASKSTSSLNDFMQNNFQEDMISDIYKKLLDDQQKAISLYITKEKKSFDKKIVLSTKNLHILSLYYYKMFHNESDLNLLFLQKKTANTNTKAAYVATKTKISTMTLWIEELMQRLSLSHIKPNKPLQMDSDYSGSNKVVTPQKFKTFLMILASLNFKSEYANVTLKMIYLRYVFSILLASRKYYFSVDLFQFSSRDKLLFIHEKAKNVYHSKRIVPVTELGNKYIEYFFKLKEEYFLSSYVPVVIKDDGKVLDFNQKNLFDWLEVYEDEIKKQCSFEEYKIIKMFIKDTILDFGRHIFSSIAHNDMDLSQDYIDAMLNHFEKGTQDQGMYCLFDNQKYFSEIREIMEQIEKEYIPYWKELS